MLPEFAEGQFEVSSEAAKANYERLHRAEQDKDTEPTDCIFAMLRLFDGLRIYRLVRNKGKNNDRRTEESAQIVC